MEIIVTITQIIFIYCYLMAVYNYILYISRKIHIHLHDRMQFYKINNESYKYTVINLFLIGDVGEHDDVFLKIYKRLCVKLMDIYKPASIVYDRNGRMSLYFHNDSNILDTISSRATSILINEFYNYNSSLKVDITMFIPSRYNIPSVNETYNHLLYNYRELDCKDSYMLKATKNGVVYSSKLPELYGFNAKLAKKLYYQYLVVK